MSTSKIVSDVIKNLSFKPVKPTGGQTKNKEWAYKQAQWKELWAACQPIKTVHRNELCELYHCSYQTVRAKVGDRPTVNKIPLTKKQSFEELRVSIMADIEDHQNSIALLKSQLAKMDSVQEFLDDPAMFEIIKKIKV